MKKKLSLFCIAFLCFGNGMSSLAQERITAINQLLKHLNGTLKCSIKEFNGTELRAEQVFHGSTLKTKSGDWSLRLNTSPVSGQPEVMDVSASFQLKKGLAKATAVSVSFDFSSWSPKNYVLVPAAVYNGNRYRSIGNGYDPPYPEDMYYNPSVPLTISNNPRLSSQEGEAAVIELATGNVATPAMCFFSEKKKKGFVVLTTQRSRLGSNGLSISENKRKDSCSFNISAPAVRKMAAGFGDFHLSNDQAPDWKAGDEVTLDFKVYLFDALNIPDLLKKFMEVRKALTGLNSPRNILPMSELFELSTAICKGNFIEVPAGSYYKPENNNDFQLGWVSGMMNTYPMLALNDKKERDRVMAELDFVVNKLQGKSGYFFGGVKASGELIPEKMNAGFKPAQAMVRKNADVLLWLMKHMLLLKAQGYGKSVKTEWENAAEKLAAAFVHNWKKDGEFGQYIAPETGEIAVFNSTAGAIVPAGLAMASDYFQKKEWLTVAQDAVRFYYKRDVENQGLTGGHCGDISQDADSESAFGFLESLMALYYSTGQKEWLDKAEVQAALAATWVFSYDPVFPKESAIGKLKSSMAGAVWASIQNKHAAPGICTASGDYIFKLFRATGKVRYADLIRDIQHAHSEAVNRPGHLTTNGLAGSSMERIQLSDAEGKSSIGNFINTRNSWTETNGVLMAMELPGVYLNLDQHRLYVFDHVQAEIQSINLSGTTILLHNPTGYDANVSVMAETNKQAEKPLSYMAFLGWPKVKVKAGESIKLLVKPGAGISMLTLNKS
ncbi:hypothetical protein [Pedobacter gandavensis]|uniref:Alpha-L-rhamnosidase six-hairpin glycosidase domain-containing protein n=1 Tax=Pedobacter gandavensis TaxID=2679963 RepID=A0ABR6EQE8_9SPHI|nr:hypothetical protein [Pedobacter gandavensis]MBB2147452.1 hypothetical protein [Pedobacter gandavensis]